MLPNFHLAAATFLGWLLLGRISIGATVLLVFLNGDRKEVELHSIDENGRVQAGESTIQLNQLREIRSLGETKTAARQAMVVDLMPSGRLLVESVTVADDRCILHGHGMNSEVLPLPLSLVQGIRLQPKLITKDIESTVNTPGKEDRLLVRVDDSLETLSGLLESLDEESVAFQWNDKTRSFPRENLVAISVAFLGGEDKHIRNCLVRLKEGDAAVWAKLHSLQGDVLKLEVAENTIVQTELSKVQSISIRSELLQFVSDLSPKSAQYQPIVTFPRLYQKDRNVSGGVLTVKDKSTRTFEKGIGVPSNSQLTYQLNKEFRTLCTTVGIDTETAGRGNCVFVIRGDDKELARVSRNGTDDAGKLEVNVEGIQILQLIVEAGADLDLADHANWCDLCLLRE